MEKYSKYDAQERSIRIKLFTGDHIDNIACKLLYNLDNIKQKIKEKERLEKLLKINEEKLNGYIDDRDELIEELNITEKEEHEEIHQQENRERNKEVYLEIMQREEERLKSKVEKFRELSSIEILRK